MSPLCDLVVEGYGNVDPTIYGNRSKQVKELCDLYTGCDQYSTMSDNETIIDGATSPQCKSDFIVSRIDDDYLQAGQMGREESPTE